MTSEPDSTPRRKPPTIDLTATEVPPEKPAASTDSAPAASAGEAAGKTAEATARPRSGGSAAVIGILAGLVTIGAAIGGLWFAGLVPPPTASNVQPAAGAPASNNSAIGEISAQLKKIEGALQTRDAEPALGSRLAAAEAQTKSLADSLAALNRRVDDVAAASQTALAQSKSAAATADGAKSAAAAGIQHGDLDALNNRIAALERATKATSEEVTRRTASADDRVARLTIAAEALRAVVERGAPFPAELAAVKTLGADQTALTVLEPFAADGVPSAAALAHDLSGLTPALRQATGTPQNPDTIFGRLQANAQRLVHITPIDAPAGDDPASVIARINADAARGDIAAALADIARLPEQTRAAVASWTKKADTRNAAIAASRRVAADALAALGKPNPQ